MTAGRIGSVVTGLCLLLLPTGAWAQVASGSFAGGVRDTSGAVLPGVTVEAASPALIEKVRSVVTDGAGLYRIVDLRPGTYTVTFTLPGFSIFRREGLELTTGFTATVNAELNVGTLEETITVSGVAPVVDTQNVRVQTTIARSTLDAIPTTKRVGQYATIIPGATYSSLTNQDVGGTQGEGGEFGIHGTKAGDLVINIEGMNQDLYSGSLFSHNAQSFQEVVLETSGTSAEAMTGGVQVNIVPKDGGNTLTGGFSATYADSSLQSENLTSALRARGLLTGKSLKRTYDTGGTLGGPIKRDKLWFFSALRSFSAQQYQQGTFYNKQHGTLFYEPDLSRVAFTNGYWRDTSLRLTWQAADKHKIVGSFSVQDNCNCPLSLLGQNVARESNGEHHYNPNYLPLVSWSYPATSRLLFEAGASAQITGLSSKRPEGVTENDIAVTELSLGGLRYGSRATGVVVSSSYSVLWTEQYIQRFSVSYITGSHTFKTGVQLREISHNKPGAFSDPNQINQARSYTFRDQRPQSVTIWSVPSGALDSSMAVGAFAQDQWTIRRLTLNLGVRYDSLNGSVPETHLPEGPFVPARSYPAVKDIPNWKNLDPRLGAAYNLFGTGKTAIKATLGRYVPDASLGPFSPWAPVNNQAASTTRTWADANGDYVPDCDLRNPAPHGECGPWNDLTFGRIRTGLAGNRRFAADALEGFNHQAFNWQSSVSLQHELRPNVALNIGYFRTWYGGFQVTDNQFVTPADYDPYCITAPVDPRLPGGGGNQLCGLYDLKPEKFGQVDNLVTLAEHYGKQREVFDGVDVTLHARFGQGGQFSGGVSTGRTVTDSCFVVDSPQEARPGFCKISAPWSSGTQVKFLVVYPLPWDFQASAVYQNMAGIPLTASYPARNAEILPSLGRNLSQCRGAATCNANVTTELIPPNTLFEEDRLQQLDLRFTRNIRMGKVKVQGNVDFYNVFNNSSILSQNVGYGPAWQTPRLILAGRLVKFSGQLDF